MNKSSRDLPSNQDFFFGSVVLNLTLCRSCFSPAMKVKSQFPILSIGYCCEARQRVFITLYRAVTSGISVELIVTFPSLVNFYQALLLKALKILNKA